MMTEVVLVGAADGMTTTIEADAPVPHEVETTTTAEGGMAILRVILRLPVKVGMTEMTEVVRVGVVDETTTTIEADAPVPPVDAMMIIAADGLETPGSLGSCPQRMGRSR